jgi:hypothetical protein
MYEPRGPKEGQPPSWKVVMLSIALAIVLAVLPLLVMFAWVIFTIDKMLNAK